MKFKTFRNIVIVVGVLLVGGLVWGTSAWLSARAREQEAVRREEERLALIAEGERIKREAEAAARDRAEQAARQAALDEQRVQDPAAYWGGAPGLRPVDKDVLELLRRPAQEKIKDATKGKPWKVNIYADDKQRFNRAKVDLDRDEKSDESWTFKPDGSIERKVAPADDENYTKTFRLDAVDGWVDLAAPKAAAASTPAGSASAAAPAAGPRAVDQDMASLLKSAAVQEKIKDATKGKPYKINLYSDDGARFNRAKVDLDRDDKWDESWAFKPDGSTERQVAPADDEKYTEVWVLTAGAWQRK